MTAPASEPTSSLLLRLAGPLQSWGERSVFGNRDTAAFPTRSGLIGMLAAAEGRARGDDLKDYALVSITVRVDRPGTRTVDFHTVGGGLPAERTIPTSEGGRRTADKATLVSRRHYLADAVFVVALSGPSTLVQQLTDALERPQWSPYLGRRSCVPDEPLVLRSGVTDPIGELMTGVPLSRRRPSNPDAAHVPVEFIWDRPPPSGDGPVPAQIATANDVPRNFEQHARRYDERDIWRTVHNLPVDLCADDVPGRRLISYAYEESA